MITVIIFIAVLGLLVFVHELGHFLLAKRAGMQVDEFGFGFPPRVFGVYKTESGRKFVFGTNQPENATSTIYSLNLIPLGGFVKIVGENNDAPDNPSSFGKKSFMSRLSVLLAGVVMNAVLAWVLITICLVSGVPTVLDEGTSLPAGTVLSTPIITLLDVNAGSPAERAGLKVGDSIMSIDGVSFQSITDLQKYVGDRKGGKFVFTVSHGGSTTKSLMVESLANPAPGSGPTGIALGLVGKLKYPLGKAVITGFTTTGTQMYAVLKGLGKLVTGGVALNQLGGPVKIAQLTGEASKLGFVYLLQFAAFLSLNLAVLNALPVPALDGGRVLFLIIEKVRRKANNPRVEQAFNAFGFLVLLLLMLVVTVNDFHGFSAIGRLLGK